MKKTLTADGDTLGFLGRVYARFERTPHLRYANAGSHFDRFLAEV